MAGLPDMQELSPLRAKSGKQIAAQMLALLGVGETPTRQPAGCRRYEVPSAASIRKDGRLC